MKKNRVKLDDLPKKNPRELSQQDLLLITGGQAVDAITSASPYLHVSLCGNYGADDCI